MSKISLILPSRDNYPSRKEWEKACWGKILKSGKLLDLSITPYERHNIVMRVAVMNRLNSGKRFQEVVRELQLSPQTVSSAKKAVKEISYRSYWERSKTERKKRIYSRDPSRMKREFRGLYRRTKYGRVYLPY